MASKSSSGSNQRGEGDAVVASKLAALEGVIRELPAAVPMDYHHECVPKGLLKYALADRGHKSGLLLQVALGAATTQVFGRPFDGFSEDEVRRAFHLGDKEGVPQSPPRKGGREALPRPLYRRFFHPTPLTEEEEAEMRQRAPEPMVAAAAAVATEAGAAASQQAQAPEGGGEPPSKRAKGPVVGSLPAAPAPVPVPVPAPAAAAPAPAEAPAPAPAPPPAPSLVLPPEALPDVDVSQLAGLRRRVSDLTQPEVLTIAEEITKKLKAKRTRAWKGNPLEVDITRENCAALGIPHYFDVVQTPMNLHVILRKIRASEYQALREFCEDVELMCQNALTFNREGEPVHTFAKETRELFRKQLLKHKHDYALREDDDDE